MSDAPPRLRPDVPLGRLPLLLALFGAIGPVSTDMYLPAFTAMRGELHGGASAAPLTLAAWFIGIAIGQLVIGPISDRVGRRAPLIGGIALYAASCVGCALSHTMPALIAWRLLSASGGAASLVVPRAIIGDISLSEQEAARTVSRVQVLMAGVPMLTPTLGGLIVEGGSWRLIFWACALFGAACGAAVLAVLPETRPPAARVHVPARLLARRYARIAADRLFLTHALTGSFATFSLFAFLGGAPAVLLRHFHVSPTVFGLSFIANGGAYALGTRLNAGMVDRFGGRRVLTGAVWSLAGVSLAMLLCAAAGMGGWLGLEIPFVAAMLVLGAALPDSAIGAIAPHTPQDGGVASALYGTAVFAIGAVGTVVAGFVADADPVPVAALMLAGAVLAIGAAWCRPDPS